MNQEPQQTRDALLAAATPLFARNGYDGTSIRAITQQAGANLGAITYHFGTKEALYEAVLDTVLGPLLPRLRSAVETAPSPLDGIEAAMRGLLGHGSRNPDVPALLAHELALDHPVPAPLRRTMMGLMEILSGLVRSGQEDGSIVAGNPMLFVFSIVTQPVHMMLMRRRLRDVFALDPDDPATRRQFENHVVQFVRRSLTATRQEGT
jgi:AcrR family transcriptional regulator